jgi:hypothetical protein
VTTAALSAADAAALADDIAAVLEPRALARAG